MTPSELIPRLRAQCMALPEAWEDTPWGHVGWKVGQKLFVIADNESLRVTVKATPDEQAALIMHPDIEVAAYIGRHGWVTVSVNSEDTFEILSELVEKSFNYVAPKRLRRPLLNRNWRA